MNCTVSTAPKRLEKLRRGGAVPVLDGDNRSEDIPHVCVLQNVRRIPSDGFICTVLVRV